MSRKPKRPLSACDKAKLKHVNSELEAKKYDSFDLDKNNNPNKINKKRPEINRSISLTSSYDKRNLITNTLPPSKSLDDQLTGDPPVASNPLTAGKKPIAFHFKNLKFKSKLPHLHAVQPTSATSLSSANQPPKLSSTKASSFDTNLLLQSRNSVPLNVQLSRATANSVRNTPNLLSLRPRSVSDCSNCALSSQVHLVHRAQHDFIKVIKRDREFINWLRKPDKSVLLEPDKENQDTSEKPKERSEENTKPSGQTASDQPTADKSNQPDSNKADSQVRQESTKIDKTLKDKRLIKREAKLNIGDVVRRFREKHKQQFPDRPPINRIKTTAICIDDYVFSWCPPGLNGEQASCEIALFNFIFIRFFILARLSNLEFLKAFLFYPWKSLWIRVFSI